MSEESARETSSDWVYETLRNEIVTLQLSPGKRLSRPHLRERFGLSSTPIRDALTRLEAEDLVHVHPQSATIVTRIDVAAARRAHIMRRALEIDIANMVLDESGDGVADRMDAILAQQTEMLRVGDIEQFDHLDSAFHRTPFEVLNLLGLWDIIRANSGHMDRIRRLDLSHAGKGELILSGHRRIVLALRNRDRSALRHILLDHLSPALARIDETRLNYPEYFAQ